MDAKTSSPRVGKLDHDVIGTAAGNWFLDGTFGYGGNFNSVYEKQHQLLLADKLKVRMIIRGVI